MEFVQGQGLLNYVRPGSLREIALSPTASDDTLLAPEDSGTRDSGRSSQRARHDGHLDEQRLRQALLQLGSGLIVLHAAGLVHRDLKPQNVEVTTDGRVVLLDFGLAQRVDDGVGGDLAGTFAYMAPEQAMGHEVTAAADWYAFGAVLYEALTGRTPHSHQPTRNLWAEARTELPPPSRWAGDLPVDLCELCMALLSFDPQSRPSEASIATALGIDIPAAQASASFRSRVHFARDAFVAREGELDSLRAAVARASHGGCPIVRIQGESGIGKSMLVDNFTREMSSAKDVLVLSSRCYEREAVPFRGIDGVVDALARQLTADHSGAIEPLSPPQYADFLSVVFPVMEKARKHDRTPVARHCSSSIPWQHA